MAGSWEQLGAVKKWAVVMLACILLSSQSCPLPVESSQGTVGRTTAFLAYGGSGETPRADESRSQAWKANLRNRQRAPISLELDIEERLETASRKEAFGPTNSGARRPPSCCGPAWGCFFVLSVLSALHFTISRF